MMAMSIFCSFLHLLTFLHQPETQGDNLTLPLSYLPPHPPPVRSSQSCVALAVLFPESLQWPPGQASPLISAGRNSSVRVGSQSPSPTQLPALFEPGAFCYTICNASCSQEPESKACPLRPAPPTLLTSPQPLRCQNQGLHSGTCSLFSFLSQTQTSLLRWALLCFPIYVPPL